jgi:replicative DNA helicase
MTIDDLIKKIESETTLAKKEVSSDEGLLRLQNVAAEYQGEYRLIWSEDTLKELKNKPQRTNHLSGVPEIDALTGGFREQQMIGIGAHSGHGKTAMGMYMLKQYETLNPVLIPLEQSSEELIEQRADNGQFVPNYLSPKKHESRVQVDWIEERIIEGIAKHNTKMVVIDHMGYIDAGNRYERAGEHIQIEKKLQDIKHLGIKWNVIVVILIQLNQLDETVPPSLKDLKGSSAIRQECDKVIFLWRKNTLSGKVRIYSNHTMFSLQKNRFNGVNGNLGLDFDFNTGEYLITPESKKWVEDMESIARSEVDADDVFNG